MKNMREQFEDNFSYNVIYIMTIDDELHKGKLKIGKASLKTSEPRDHLPPNCHALNQAAKKRIDGYTQTAGVPYRILHTELAIKDEVSDSRIYSKAFMDSDVHRVLKHSGFPNASVDQTTGREWFEVDLETAKKAIQAVKKGEANLGADGHVLSTPILLRPEQEECVQAAVRHFKKSSHFLINAKMRYGKTFVGLEIIKRSRFKKTIIVTHRPVVNAGWYQDFQKIFAGTDYRYGSKTNGYAVRDLNNKDIPFVYFASLQDLRDSNTVGGKYEKNEDIFSTVWDCVVIDEAHEGTQTALGDKTIQALIKDEPATKLLSLSGTPFNILNEYAPEEIYTWDYVMEQEQKNNWDRAHFGDHNPYSDLPELKIYTYDLGDILKTDAYDSLYDKAFNFREFFRTWTGDIRTDHDPLPENARPGEFVHEKDVWSFLNLLTADSETSAYPYSSEKYRSIFRHTFWMVPGVGEALALEKLMQKHPVFGSGAFDILNVAGDGNPDDPKEEALHKVQQGIKRAEKSGRFTITLSCGKLTTGVTIPEWTGVLMLAGSYNTSAASYLQTIFRVQSPANINGKTKETGYVFDFAPDRTLKMVVSAVQVSAQAGKTKKKDKDILGKFLNYCPVISISGSSMRRYSTERLLQQLKKAYTDKVVANGFDDYKLYNDQLLSLSEQDLSDFNHLSKLVRAGQNKKKQDISINDTGLTDEEYAGGEGGDNTSKKSETEGNLSEEEKKRRKEQEEKRRNRVKAVSTLREISIRMPLLIYGADIPYTDDITLDRFVELVDDSSWNEFMPQGVTKELFSKFKRFYDEEIFIASGRKIRQLAYAADALSQTERVKAIAGIFATFRNPDKETVLTPWRTVNMHLSTTIGGFCFFDESFANMLDEPRLVDRSGITGNIFGSADSHILEINSKTGLYPLYMAYSCFRCQSEGISEPAVLDAVWKNVIQNNIFVVCKTPMAKAITRRTLLGFQPGKANLHYFDQLINMLQNKMALFTKKVNSGQYWKKGDVTMRFSALVGNPPYAIRDGGGSSGASAKPIYQHFINAARDIKPEFISMITPSRWFAGGKGLDAFRDSALHDRQFAEFTDFADSKYCFPNVDIPGGVNYFLWKKDADKLCSFTYVDSSGRQQTSTRALDEFDILIRSNQAVTIIRKVMKKGYESLSVQVMSRKPFGLESKQKSDGSGELQLRSGNKGNGSIARSKITAGQEMIDQWKTIVSKTTTEHAGIPDKKTGQMKLFSVVEVLPPGSVCTESYLVAGSYDNPVEAENLQNYLKTKFARFLIAQALASMNISKASFRFVPQLDFHRSYSDAELYELFELTDEEVSTIEDSIKNIN